MKAVSNIEFRENEIKFLLNQIEKINKLIHLYKSHDDDFSVSEYTRHRQDFINQLNIQLHSYKLQISEAA